MCERSLVDWIRLTTLKVVGECGGIDSIPGTECEVACPVNYTLYDATSNAYRCVDVDDTGHGEWIAVNEDAACAAGAARVCWVLGSNSLPVIAPPFF